MDGAGFSNFGAWDGEGNMATGWSPPSSSNTEVKKSNTEVKKILNEALKEAYSNTAKTMPADYINKAEEILAKSKKEHNLHGDNPLKYDELVTVISWTLWETSEKIGEFSAQSEKTVEDVMERNSKEIAQKIQEVYTDPACFNDPVEQKRLLVKIRRYGSGRGTCK